ncbi:MAG: LLM class flavin-dependent oxidoreductase [Chloroflexi bacterium]|nr:LLM class flavin-dependent oxidoreductase [Chloroflexota bacterium]
MATRRLTVGAPGHLLPPVENLIRNTQRSEAQGYDALWWPDHLMSWYPDGLWTPDLVELARHQPNAHVFFDALLAMAVAATHSERVLLGTSVTEPLRRHPATLAQAFLTLDHLSKGRAILGIGAGEAENVVPYGLDFRHQASKLEEALAIIRLLWEHDEPVDFDGRFWTLRGAVLGLGPYRPGVYPPIYVAAVGTRTLEIAGRYADGWLPTFLPPADYGAKFAALKRAAAAHGRDPARIVGALWAYTVVAETHEECHPPARQGAGARPRDRALRPPRRDPPARRARLRCPPLHPDARRPRRGPRSRGPGAARRPARGRAAWHAGRDRRPARGLRRPGPPARRLLERHLRRRPEQAALVVRPAARRPGALPLPGEGRAGPPPGPGRGGGRPGGGGQDGAPLHARLPGRSAASARYAATRSSTSTAPTQRCRQTSSPCSKAAQPCSIARAGPSPRPPARPYSRWRR